MRLNSKLFNALWYSNGKKCTIMTYIYTVIGTACIMYGDATAGMLCLVMAELNKVDREVRFLATEQAQEIISFNDKEDEKDDS